MQFFKKRPNYDFMGSRKPFLIASLVLVLVSIALAFIVGPKFGIDFVGGTEMQVTFQNDVTSAQLRGELRSLGFEGSDVVTFGAGQSEFLIRLQSISPVSEQQAEAAKKSLETSFGGNALQRFELSPGGDKLTLRLDEPVEIARLEEAVTKAGLELGTLTAEAVDPEKVAKEAAAAPQEDEEDSMKQCESRTCAWSHQEDRVYEVALIGVSEKVMEGLRGTEWGQGAQKLFSQWVGPKVGKQLRDDGIASIVFALLFIMLYIAIRFDLRFAPGAVVALIHDIFITVGIFTIFRVEVTMATVAALLTIVGYSLNDTIVVFDRIRENLGKIKERRLSQVINVSINETLSRTVLTSLTTLIVVVALLSIGWRTTIRDFAFALLIGVFVGTYSSIFVASPIVVWLDTRFAKKKA